MPILTSIPIRHFDQKAFHQLDEVMTGLAFDIHNDLGRYLNEKLYQTELVRRLYLRGLDAHSEAGITISLGDYQKTYFVDIVVNNGVFVEVKAVETINASHRSQLLSYLFLCDQNHGTLLNFRSSRVQREFVSTKFSRVSRSAAAFDLSQWRPMTSRCVLIRESVNQALTELGSGLGAVFYRDLLTWVLGGEANVVQNIPVFSNGFELGTQKMHLLEPTVAFSVTAMNSALTAVREHQQRMLRHTQLDAIQWINLGRQTATMTTITL